MFSALRELLLLGAPNGMDQKKKIEIHHSGFLPKNSQSGVFFFG